MIADPPDDNSKETMGVGGSQPRGDIAKISAAEEKTSSILVVDDNEGNRDALSRRLQRRGYSVATARDGLDALKQIGEANFDLVLLDVMMPGMSGLEVLAHLRRTYDVTDLPVIMVTAKDQSEDVVAALNGGANDYVTKPLDFPVLLARVQTHLSLKHSVARIRALESRLALRNAELEVAAERTRRDLLAAASIQESYLPQVPLDGVGMKFAWRFKPCQALAGDSLNICRLDDDHIGVYVLDVAGHGVTAALLAVAVTRALSGADGPDSLLVHRAGEPFEGLPVAPAEVADRLNRKFAWDPATRQFLTIFYAILNIRTGECRYVSAGHPGPVFLPRGLVPELLNEERSGLPIGIGESYQDSHFTIQAGDRLYLYSDGVYEAMSPDRQFFGRTRLLEVIHRAQGASLEDSVAMLMKEIEVWCGAPASDDISVLAIQRE